MKKRSIPLLISAIIGIIYLAFLIPYFLSLPDYSMYCSCLRDQSFTTALDLSQVVGLTIAVAFNIFAFFFNKKGTTLATIAIYCLPAFSLLKYSAPLIPLIALSLWSYILMARRDKTVEDEIESEE